MSDTNSLSAILPRNKSDTESAKALAALGYPAIEPVIPELLAWMQDMNWPVAQALQPILASIGAPLAPHIQRILATRDHTWIGWILDYIVAESAELRSMFKPDLERLASHPTPDEQIEELNVRAHEILQR